MGNYSKEIFIFKNLNLDLKLGLGVASVISHVQGNPNLDEYRDIV